MMYEPGTTQLFRQLTRFYHQWLSPEDGLEIVEVINAQNLQPYEYGASLHAWTAKYDIGGVKYELFGDTDGTPQSVRVGIIRDRYPEDGPVLKI